MLVLVAVVTPLESVTVMPGVSTVLVDASVNANVSVLVEMAEVVTI